MLVQPLTARGQLTDQRLNGHRSHIITDQAAGDVATHVPSTRKIRAICFITDRVSEQGNAIGRVRPAVCLFPLCLLNYLTFD